MSYFFDLTDNYLCLSALQIAAALLLDRCCGEVKCFHPLVGFGNIAHWLEKQLNYDGSDADPENKISAHKHTRLQGCLAWLVLVLPLPILLYLLQGGPIIWDLANTLVLYFAIAQQSLKQHAMQIYHPLQQQNLTKARHFTGYMVSRDTAQLSSDEMSRATVESVLENGHDAVIASLFYFVLGGAALVILHRLANTLDAMWGYKTPRFKHFGWWAARADDHLAWLSAYCSSALYAMQSGSVSQAIGIIKRARQQSRNYKSKNGGLCMATGAAVLGFSLGGRSYYQGKLINSPPLGEGRKVELEDIPPSLLLVKTSAWLLCVLVFVLGLLWHSIS
ncbi:CobD/CbiB family cobalamin biosynthesis protein [Paraglaciecola sp.]|uniref:cobalamin biosynthesis protein CobD/CbiB n=1 Tax=Paraglaciecola sp. TaxID=1920173 RepID=UPI0030F4AB89